MAGSPLKKQRRLEAMVAAGILDEGEEPTRIEYEAFQDKAVNALMACDGDPVMAMRYMGLDLEGLDRHEIRRRAAAIYADHRLVARLKVNYKDLDAMKVNVLARQIKIALHGTNEEATRAAMLLSRVGGWAAPEKHEHAVKAVTLHGLLSDASRVDEFLAGTAHEPGEATAVYSEVLEGEPKRVTPALAPPDEGGE